MVTRAFPMESGLPLTSYLEAARAASKRPGVDLNEIAGQSDSEYSASEYASGSEDGDRTFSGVMGGKRRAESHRKGSISPCEGGPHEDSGHEEEDVPKQARRGRAFQSSDHIVSRRRGFDKVSAVDLEQSATPSYRNKVTAISEYQRRAAAQTSFLIRKAQREAEKQEEQLRRAYAEVATLVEGPQLAGHESTAEQKSRFQLSRASQERAEEQRRFVEKIAQAEREAEDAMRNQRGAVRAGQWMLLGLLVLVVAVLLYVPTVVPKSGSPRAGNLSNEDLRLENLDAALTSANFKAFEGA